MAYTPTNWTNFPSTATPVNASNLNKIENELVALDTGKADESAVTTALEDKVDKVAGKGLSTNDYDNTAKGIVDGVTTALAGKVDKVAGKGLSTEDFTTAEKTKLAGISAEANKVEITPVVTEGTTLATISIDGVDTDIKGSDIDVDDEMSPTSENPVQNKVITSALNDKANKIDSDSISGGALELLTPEFDENEPYVYRQSCNGKSNLAPIMKEQLIGGSVVWNQLIPDNKKSKTVTPDGTQTYSADYIGQITVPFEYGHIYFVSAKYTYGGSKTLRCYISVGGAYGKPARDIGTETKKMKWLVQAGNTSQNVVIGMSNITTSDKLTADDEWSYDEFNFIDLTQELGTTIANYVYSLEVATANSGIAWLDRYIDLATNHAYSSPTIQSTKVSAKKVTGKNLLNNNSTYPQTLNGITFRKKDDGSVSIQGTGTSDGAIIVIRLNLKAGNYLFNGCPTGSGATLDTFIWDNTTNARAKKWDGVTNSVSAYSNLEEVQILEGHAYTYNMRVTRNQTFSSEVVKFYPMICLPTTTDNTYEPYHITTYDLSGSHLMLIELSYQTNLYLMEQLDIIHIFH